MKGKTRNQSLLKNNLKKDTPFFGNFFALLKYAAQSGISRSPLRVRPAQIPAASGFP
jgi:hypothetical protein